VQSRHLCFLVLFPHTFATYPSSYIATATQTHFIPVHSSRPSQANLKYLYILLVLLLYSTSSICLLHRPTIRLMSTPPTPSRYHRNQATITRRNTATDVCQHHHPKLPRASPLPASLHTNRQQLPATMPAVRVITNPPVVLPVWISSTTWAIV
jgi:hypothetical protein